MNYLRVKTCLRALSALLVISTLSVAHYGAAVADTLIPPFSATYSVRVGIARGETHMRMSDNGDGSFLFESEIQPKGVAKLFARGNIKETSHFRYGAHGVMPIDYARIDTIKDRNSRIEFDWTNGIARSTYKEQFREVSLAPGMLDTQLVLFAFMHDLLNAHQSLEYSLIDRKGRIKTYRVTSLGEEKIKTPAGQFETVVFRHQTKNSDRTTTFWCAPELNYLPARIEQQEGDDKPSRAELKKFQAL